MFSAQGYSSPLGGSLKECYNNDMHFQFANNYPYFFKLTYILNNIINAYVDFHVVTSSELSRTSSQSV